MLEQNLDRVVDSALRALVPGREAEAEGAPETGADAATSRKIMADLCGHVAFALRSLESQPHPVGSFRGTIAAPPVDHPSLDVRR
ncbi:MAG TPA: hypothetical protein VGT98_15350 [Candidatus Elarobacter sp.]|nr:hypothetical protein [Candidatus Elarobacter sp.]